MSLNDFIHALEAELSSSSPDASLLARNVLSKAAERYTDRTHILGKVTEAYVKGAIDAIAGKYEISPPRSLQGDFLFDSRIVHYATDASGGVGYFRVDSAGGFHIIGESDYLLEYQGVELIPLVVEISRNANTRGDRLKTMLAEARYGTTPLFLKVQRAKSDSQSHAFIFQHGKSYPFSVVYFKDRYVFEEAADLIGEYFSVLHKLKNVD